MMDKGQWGEAHTRVSASPRADSSNASGTSKRTVIFKMVVHGRNSSLVFFTPISPPATRSGIAHTTATFVVSRHGKRSDLVPTTTTS